MQATDSAEFHLFFLFFFSFAQRGHLGINWKSKFLLRAKT